MIAIPELEPAAIRAARDAVDPVFLGAPQFVHEGLSARLGVPVIVKVETVNPIRSFKGRGTSVVVRALAADGRIGPDRPVVCASAGNFGQGVAFAARGLGIPTVVFASRGRTPARSPGCGRSAPTVIQVGDDFDAARAAADAHAAETRRAPARRRRRRRGSRPAPGRWRSS